MPHSTLRLVGGVIENETPVINQSGIAVSNRIRFRPDPQGLSLPEKLGGWAKFYASTITNGIVRALWGWQDTSNNQWIAYGSDNTTAAQLGVIQCTVNGATGLTSATGTLKDITPFIRTVNEEVIVVGTVGSNIFQIVDTHVNPQGPPRVSSVYIVTPISACGVVLQGMYSVVPATPSGSSYSIYATDVLGNPLLPAYSTISGGAIAIINVTFTGGSPNTLTITFASNPGAFPSGSNANVQVADNTITGSYIVLSSTNTSVTVATTLSSYTYATTGVIDNLGVVPIFNTVSGSSIVTVVFPDHGQSVGSYFDVLTPTLVGGVTIQGQYAVQSVANSYTFTINAQSSATATSSQYQGALTVTGGSRTGTTVTLNTASSVFTFPLAGNFGLPAFVQGVNPANWNGIFTILAGNLTATSLTYTDASATGSYVSGGSYSLLRGTAAYVYFTTSTASLGGTLPYPAQFWSLDNWGNDLLACSGSTDIITYPNGFGVPYQPIMFWDPTQAFLFAQPIAGAPPASNGFFVAMPQRQIVAWGTTFSGVIDPLLIRWCDVNNFNTWVAQITNQAGSFRLPSGAAIIGARQVFQQGLIWTDIELWAVQYIGQPYVYGFNKIGQGCGLIGKYAHGVLGGVTYWMGKTQIFMLSGDGVMPIPCPIWDVAFQDLDLVNAGKIVCATNSMFQEVAWYFPVKSGSGENSQYIKYNVTTSTWDYGNLDRSAWIDVSVLQQPIGFSPVNHLIYQHEISPDADGAAMGEFFTTGWFAIADGDQMPYTDQWWPDFKFGYYNQTQNANITMTFSGRDYPEQTIYPDYGPYTITTATTYFSPRIRHRLQSFTVSGTGTGTWWRLGGVRYRWQPDGKY